MFIALRLFTGLWVAALCAGGAWAQAADDGLTLVPPESLLGCLETGGSSRPVYPEREAALKMGAVVRVGLTFVTPDKPPKVEISYNSGGDVFADAVKAYLKAYRLPCMSTNAAPVAGVQEFQFVPDDGRKVIYGKVRDDQSDSESDRVRRCLTGMRSPRYPMTFGRPPEGTVIVRLKFLDGSSPPQTAVLFNGGSDRLSAAVLEVVKSYRVPCLSAADEPITAMQAFTFVMSDSTRYVLKDLQLRQFVAAIDKLPHQSARFDFSTMSCPFDVRLRLFQPHAPNQVGEVERADPNRREFIEWLRTVSLALPSDAARQVVGQAITISVPCGVLDLS